MAKKRNRNNYNRNYYNDFYYDEAYCLTDRPKEKKIDRILSLIEDIDFVSVLKKVAITVAVLLYVAAALSLLISYIKDPTMESFFLKGELKLLYCILVAEVIPFSTLVILCR